MNISVNFCFSNKMNIIKFATNSHLIRFTAKIPLTMSITINYQIEYKNREVLVNISQGLVLSHSLVLTCLVLIDKLFNDSQTFPLLL